MQDGHLYGSLIDILRFGAPLILVALGMTLVIATGGIDLSVGVGGGDLRRARLPADQRAGRPERVGGVLVADRPGARCSAWCSGCGTAFLVAGIGIQPIIATLILMVAGRGLAQLITDGQIITINSAPYKLIGGGYWLDPAVLASSSRWPCVAADRVAHPADRARPAHRVGRRQRRGQPAGRHPLPAA